MDPKKGYLGFRKYFEVDHHDISKSVGYSLEGNVHH